MKANLVFVAAEPVAMKEVVLERVVVGAAHEGHRKKIASELAPTWSRYRGHLVPARGLGFLQTPLKSHT